MNDTELSESMEAQAYLTKFKQALATYRAAADAYNSAYQVYEEAAQARTLAESRVNALRSLIASYGSEFHSACVKLEQDDYARRYSPD